MKKKGFTLIEVLVALACTSILLAAVSSCLYFYNKANLKVADNSSDMYKITVVKDYIITNEITDNSNFKIVDGDVSYNESILVYDSTITWIDFELVDNLFWYCDISYNVDEHYTFIVRGNN